MHILYVAKHNSGGNDDEGSITHALESLGHTVEKVSEQNGMLALNIDADFLLFHGWTDIHTLKKITIPKVFWYFDLIEYNDTGLEDICRQRMEQIHAVTNVVDIGFCTDGDWVSKDTTGKLVKLTQGADSRIIGYGTPQPKTIDILFTGNNKWGTGRKTFVEHMVSKYRPRFVHKSKGCYRLDLKELIARTKVVICPWSPVTDNYWSNRVYVAAGFGAMVLHPHSKSLAREYEDDRQIVFYSNQQELHEKIRFYLDHWFSEEIRRNALSHTVLEHTYKHRCATLIRHVKERLVI